MLRLVARLLADNVKGRDTVARYGGEEFAILLTGAGLRAAEVVARQINEALSSKRLATKGTAASFDHVTISVGVAQARPGEAAAALVERADAALYEAKRTGRNRVCVEAPAKARNTTAAVASARGWARLPGAAATLGSDGAPNRPCTNELPSGRNAQHVCATPNACDDGEVG
ncbi:MAG: GGDEF domain-containing protein [Janthinobacterium lividum]